MLAVEAPQQAGRARQRFAPDHHAGACGSGDARRTRCEPRRSQAKLAPELVQRDAASTLSLRRIIGRDVLELLGRSHQPIEGVGIHDRAHPPTMTSEIYGFAVRAINQPTKLVACLGCCDLHDQMVPRNVHSRGVDAREPDYTLNRNSTAVRHSIGGTDESTIDGVLGTRRGCSASAEPARMEAGGGWVILPPAEGVLDLINVER